MMTENNNYNEIPGMFIVPGEPEEVTKVRAHILDSFKDLQFDEGPHVYTLHGNKIPSVTTILGKYEQPFNAQEVATSYAKKNGMTPEYWLRQWKWKNKIATTTGTLVHEFGESLAYVAHGHPELITESCKCKYLIDENWLIPTRAKEEAVIKFWSDVPPCLHFVLAEAKMYTNSNPDPRTHLKQQLAGTADIIFWYIDENNPRNNGIVIGDYKNNEELQKEYSRSHNKMMLPPFDQFYSEPLSEYVAQFSTYQIPLEDIGLPVIARRLIWLKPDGTYEKIATPDISQLIRANL